MKSDTSNGKREIMSHKTLRFDVEKRIASEQIDFHRSLKNVSTASQEKD